MRLNGLKWSQLKVPFTPLRSLGITPRTKPHKAPILNLIQSRLNFDAPSTVVLLYCLLSLEKQLFFFFKFYSVCFFECSLFIGFNVVSM